METGKLGQGGGGKTVKEKNYITLVCLRQAQEIESLPPRKGPFQGTIQSWISTQGLVVESPMYPVRLNLDFIIFQSQKTKKFNVFE